MPFCPQPLELETSTNRILISLAPVLLHRRAQQLTKMTGSIYKTQIEIQQGPKTLRRVLKIALSRPWILLVLEPIVTVLAIYQAIIYATLYLCFGKYETRASEFKLMPCYSCVSDRLPGAERLVSWYRRPCISGRYSVSNLRW